MWTFLFGLLFITPFVVCNTTSKSRHREEDIVKATLEKLSTDVSDLKQIVSSQSQELRELKVSHGKELAEQKRELALVQAENKELKEFCRKEKASNINISKRLLLLNQPQSSLHSNKIAFTARLSQHITGLGNKQPIAFEDVVSNHGNCYSPITGVFTSTINGTFFFFASMMSHSNEYLETEIVKNGVREALMYNYVPNTFDQGVNAAVLGLAEGDKVWVRHVDTQGSKVYGSTWSSFSGFQI